MVNAYCRPFSHDQTYWQSEPVTNLSADKSNIYYKLAIYVSKTSFGEEKIIFEGFSSQDDHKVLEYQHLLTLYNDLTINVLGYDVQRTHYVLDNKFPSGSFLDALEDYKQVTLPLDTKEQMYTAIMNLVHHNAFQMKFDWLIIFIIVNEIDPNYAFIDRLKSLKYSNET
ncbi:hypothetical protein RclHR1_16710004 [Rhizophagus clarus]|uniref:Uncharacterized protein n=1 Tax=Rhizophagus clarus TaxID=94130 RepID=A0A2Z6RB03_9GLOM|nr:hypothetical protein RclHR1_16710004 [Rhizophagus clarus]